MPKPSLAHPTNPWARRFAPWVGGALGLFAGFALGGYLEHRFEGIPRLVGWLLIGLGWLAGRSWVGEPLSRLESDERFLAVLLVTQVSVILVVLFVPFGFDHPSALGLSFGHVLALTGLYLLVLTLGLVLGVVLRRWWMILGELALPSLVLLFAFGGFLRI